MQVLNLNPTFGLISILLFFLTNSLNADPNDNQLDIVDNDLDEYSPTIEYYMLNSNDLRVKYDFDDKLPAIQNGILEVYANNNYLAQAGIENKLGSIDLDSDLLEKCNESQIKLVFSGLIDVYDNQVDKIENTFAVTILPAPANFFINQERNDIVFTWDHIDCGSGQDQIDLTYYIKSKTENWGPITSDRFVVSYPEDMFVSILGKEFSIHANGPNGLISQFTNTVAYESTAHQSGVSDFVVVGTIGSLFLAKALYNNISSWIRGRAVAEPIEIRNEPEVELPFLHRDLAGGSDDELELSDDGWDDTDSGNENTNPDLFPENWEDESRWTELDTNHPADAKPIRSRHLNIDSDGDDC